MNESISSLRQEPTEKRVRAVLGGRVVADTTGARLVWEVPYAPTYYLPVEAVHTDLVPEPALTRGEGELAGLVKLEWAAMDAWFEEEEQVYSGPRNPYHRVDILDSSRHIRVAVAGETVAESSHPRLLFETGLPPRFYLSKLDVRLDLLEPGDTVTHCPYKGQAAYWSVRIGEKVFPDVVWSYPTPLPESQKIAGLVAFWTEKVDLYVDGEKYGGRG
jgi:uncharacterized protein (DUF427 family)